MRLSALRSLKSIIIDGSSCSRDYDQEFISSVLLSHLSDDDPNVDPQMMMIHRACENGWLEVTQLLLQTFSLDPNTLDYQRTNLRPLHLAARGGHEELVQSLISKGATLLNERG